MSASSPRPVDDAERAVVAEIARRERDLVGLLADLIAFDTRAPEADLAPRAEAALQHYVAGRLERAGLESDVWEPDPAELSRGRYAIPEGHHFEGRPQLLARARGLGGGRDLLFNGHVDVVSVEPREQWSSDPFRADLRDGRVYGRGACDMKGGVAAMILATEVLRELRVPLRGDLLVSTVTDEESTGAGSLAVVARGVHADGCVIPEPTAGTAWLGTRGTLMPQISVRGRAGHAGFPHGHWTDGGPVNAIEKLDVVLRALYALRDEWQQRADAQHPYLRAGTIVPVSVSGGEWIVSYPASATLRCHVQYQPQQADADGWGTAVEQEIERRVLAACDGDPWLAAHPPRFEWRGDAPPGFHGPDEPISAALLGAMDTLGLGRAIGDRTTFFDGPTFSRAGIPAIAFGPGDVQFAHAVDEFVPVDELVRSAQVLALVAMRFCGRP